MNNLKLSEVDIEFFQLLTDEELIVLFGKRIDDINVKIEKFKQLKDDNYIIKAGLNWGLPVDVKINKLIELENKDPVIVNDIIKCWCNKSDNFKFECIKNINKFKNEDIKNNILGDPVEEQKRKDPNDVSHLSDKEKNKLFLSMTHEPTINRVALEWKGLRRKNLEKKFLELKSYDQILLAGKYWNISDKVKNKKFIEIVESDVIDNKHFIFDIVESWRGIKEKNLEKKFMQLKNVHLIDTAARNWNLSDSVINKKFLSFWDDKNKKMKYDECHIYGFGITWNNLYEKTLNYMFTKLKNKEFIYKAWIHWRNITDKSKKIQLEYLKSL